MTRDQIITQLFTGKNFNDCIRKMEPEHLQDDLKMEVMAIVCGWSSEKVIELYENKALDFFVVRVILNQIQSTNSAFYRKYRRIIVPFEAVSGINTDSPYEVENDVIYSRTIKKHVERLITKEEEMLPQDRERKEKAEDIALKEIDRLYWYDQELLRLYLKHGSYRAIQEETGIPFTSCYKTIQKTFKELKEKALCSIST